MTNERDTMRLRDHTRLCEHGSLTPHWTTDGTGRWWKEPECYGGREVVLKSVGDGLWREVEGNATDHHEG